MFRFGRKPVAYLAILSFWLIIFLAIQYLTRDSGYSNVEFPEDNDRYVFWPLMIILLYLMFRDNSPKSMDKPNKEISIADPENRTEYILGIFVFIISYVFQRRYTNDPIGDNYSSIFSLSGENLNYIVVSFIITSMILIMRYPWEYSSDYL